MKLIIGLGNPGNEYANTRHNIGFMALDAYASKNNIDFFLEPKFKGMLAVINHLGKNKNSKIVFEGKHNFVCFVGTSKIALLTIGIIPYADWVNAIEIEYQRSIKFIPKIMTGISIDLNY